MLPSLARLSLDPPPGAPVGMMNTRVERGAPTLDEASRADREVVLAAVKQNGNALQYASPELRDDREVVLAAVAEDLYAMLYASHKLKADRDFVLDAVEQDAYALYYASPELRADREVVLAAVAKNGTALEFASPGLQADRDVVLAAVAQNGYALAYASPWIRRDHEVVLAAVAQDGKALQYASPGIRRDHEVVLAAVAQNGDALHYASPGLQADRGVVLAAVAQNGYALYYASPGLRDDRAFLLAAVAKSGDALQHASPGLKADPGVMLVATTAKQNPRFELIPTVEKYLLHRINVEIESAESALKAFKTLTNTPIKTDAVVAKEAVADAAVEAACSRIDDIQQAVNKIVQRLGEGPVLAAEKVQYMAALDRLNEYWGDIDINPCIKFRMRLSKFKAARQPDPKRPRIEAARQTGLAYMARTSRGTDRLGAHWRDTQSARCDMRLAPGF